MATDCFALDQSEWQTCLQQKVNQNFQDGSINDNDNDNVVIVSGDVWELNIDVTNPTGASWIPKDPMPVPIQSFSVMQYRRKVYAFSGLSSVAASGSSWSHKNRIQEYDIDGDSWAVVGATLSPNSGNIRGIQWLGTNLGSYNMNWAKKVNVNKITKDMLSSKIPVINISGIQL